MISSVSSFFTSRFPSTLEISLRLRPREVSRVSGNLGCRGARIHSCHPADLLSIVIKFAQPFSSQSFLTPLKALGRVRIQVICIFETCVVGGGLGASWVQADSRCRPSIHVVRHSHSTPSIGLSPFGPQPSAQKYGPSPYSLCYIFA